MSKEMTFAQALTEITAVKKRYQALAKLEEVLTVAARAEAQIRVAEADLAKKQAECTDLQKAKENILLTYNRTVQACNAKHEELAGALTLKRNALAREVEDQAARLAQEKAEHEALMNVIAAEIDDLKRRRNESDRARVQAEERFKQFKNQISEVT